MTDQLSPKDLQLIDLLRVNAREPVSALARKLGLSRTTVQDRLRKLEDRRIITGYAVKLGEVAHRRSLKAVVTIEIEPRRSVDVTRALHRFAEVEQLYTVSGKFDLVAMLRAASAEDLDRVLDDIGLIPGVTGTESAVVLSTKLDRR
ncbi:Lrp/AsnC family transcriptional regulator [Rhodoligotrophos ferricapiens]|uniref:Lrp/AsnC family transcriptional regulator n=1 Tax=Rhodoligotrophos ferricapiens TaxID=3069264 RepID=UPI00315DE97B